MKSIVASETNINTVRFSLFSCLDLSQEESEEISSGYIREPHPEMIRPEGLKWLTGSPNPTMLFPDDTNESNANNVEQQFSTMSLDGAIDWDNLIGITSNHYPTRQISSSTDEEEYEDRVIELANNNEISSLSNLR